MSTSVKTLMAFALVAFAAACAAEEESVYVAPEPIVEEQEYTKY